MPGRPPPVGNPRRGASRGVPVPAQVALSGLTAPPVRLPADPHRPTDHRVGLTSARGENSRPLALALQAADELGEHRRALQRLDRISDSERAANRMLDPIGGPLMIHDTAFDDNPGCHETVPRRHHRAAFRAVRADA